MHWFYGGLTQFCFLFIFSLPSLCWPTPVYSCVSTVSVVCPLSVYVHCSLSHTHTSLAHSQCLHSAGPLLCIPVCPLSVYVHCLLSHTHTSLAHSQCLHSAGPFLCIPVCPLSVYVHCLLSHTHLTHAYHRPCNVGLTVSPVVVTQCVPCRNLCVVCVLGC